MCGFVGVKFIRSPGRVPIRERLASISHRGPDEKTFYRDPDGRLEMGFARLSIIDLSTGSQPVSNESGDIVAVLNGEIYNYVELSSYLRARGHRFRSHGDAETIVHLYEEFGDDFLLRLEGMFSIVLWDRARGRLLLARDPFGIKPLYYALDSEHLFFGSEVKALLGLPGVGREPDLQAVSEYLAYQYVPAPRTFFRDVRKIPPGHKLIVDPGGHRLEAYWDCAQVLPVSGDRDEIGRRVLTAFDDSIRLHLRSDVPVAAFLSGGIDSGLMVARAAAISPGLRTFTLRFSGGNDESALAEDLARRCGTRHQTFTVRAENLVDTLPRILWSCDEPVGDSALLPSFVISRLASEAGIKVVLSGAGGDELFAGYNHYFPNPRELPFQRHSRLAAGASWILGLVAPEASAKIDRALAYESDPWRHYLGHTTVWSWRQRRALFDPPFPLDEDHEARLRHLNRSRLDSLNTKLYADLRTYLPEDILCLSDRMTMIHSIEGRVPFLYRPLVELALGIPAGLKAPDGRRKGFLRDLAAPILPESFLKHPKMGFNSPMDHWLGGPLGDVAAAQLLSERSLSRPWWNRRGLARFARAPRSGGAERERFFTLWLLELFCRIHIDAKSAPMGGVRLSDL